MMKWNTFWFHLKKDICKLNKRVNRTIQHLTIKKSSTNLKVKKTFKKCINSTIIKTDITFYYFRLRKFCFFGFDTFWICRLYNMAWIRFLPFFIRPWDIPFYMTFMWIRFFFKNSQKFIVSFWFKPLLIDFLIKIYTRNL